MATSAELFVNRNDQFAIGHPSLLNSKRLSLMNHLFKYTKFGLFTVGLVYWYLFYFRGAPAITHGDWLKEQVYLDTLRTALVDFRIPWEWSDSFYHGVSLFMANAEVAFTPDIFLLRIISNNQYFYLHHCLFYVCGFYALNKIAAVLQLRTLAFVFLYLLFNFNGYITSHIAEGHFQWTGYYLIPLFFYCLYQSCQRPEIGSEDVSAGAVLGILFLNGSFHLVTWLSLFILFFYMFSPHKWGKLLVVLVVGYGLGAFRIVPALLYFPTSVLQGMQAGYTDLSLLLNAMTQLRGHGYGTSTVMGWWEYNLYVGFTGFFLVVVGVCLYLRGAFQEPLKPFNYPWLLATILMFLLSLGNTWGILASLHLPFGTIERVSSRFIILPFFVCIVAAAYSLDLWLKALDQRKFDLFFCILLLFISIDLLYQLLNWGLVTTQAASGGAKAIPTVNILDSSNRSYMSTVYLSWIFSGVMALASGLFLLSRPTQRIEHSTVGVDR